MYIPHCPHPRCSKFPTQHNSKWYIHYGYHHTKAFGTIPRFKCKSCGRSFSTQSFSIDYYAKKVLDYKVILRQAVSGSSLMDTGRTFLVRPETVQNRLSRLARVSLAIHSDLLKCAPMEEEFVADGFESFSFSQYYPHHVNPLVGRESEFIYALGFANLRRKGRMTSAQKRKRARLEVLGKADPKAIMKSFMFLGSELLQRLGEKGVTRSAIYTDEHRAYAIAFSRVNGFRGSITHCTVSSKAIRSRANPLFPVNYLDRQFRKDLSDHGRETVKFAHCPAAMMMRMSVYRLFHNCLIHRRVREYRKGHRVTHAEAAGILREDLDRIITNHWGRRAFLHKIDLGVEELKTWFELWSNPGRTTRHRVPYYVAC